MYRINQSGRYVSKVYHHKQYSLGHYALAADAALARDRCLQQLGKSVAPNFASNIAYAEAREKEMKNRGINVLSENVLMKISSRVNAVSSKVERATNAQREEILVDSGNNNLVYESVPIEGPEDETIRCVFAATSVISHDSPFSTSYFLNQH